jgi:putative hydrolase of the HAD superfamily
MSPQHSPWRAIVFDLDDTLYPEGDFVLSGFRAVAGWASRSLGIPSSQAFAELETLFLAGVRGNTFDRWLAGHGFSPEPHVGQLVRVYREHTPDLKPFPEAPSLLVSLHRQHRLGLVSDGYLAVQQRKLAALGLEHHFDAIVFSDTWGRKAWKPNPKPFREVLRMLEAEPQRAVYVGDNPAKDFLGARRVGMAAVRIQYPQGQYSRVDPLSPQHAPDVTLSSLAELEPILQEDGELFQVFSTRAS